MVSKFPLSGVDELIRTGGNYHVEANIDPKYKIGDRVRIVNLNPTSHTRLPAYVRGKVGKIDKNFGIYVFPDTICHDKGEKPQYLYNVAFDAAELWGVGAKGNDRVYLSIFEDYIVDKV
ncbi:SH3-like domain-containing protein [Aminobacter sp. MSH1]|uniref:SH3-like domain-containing protein n=1 Tax=Aminobacter sp. MSH1 TaxID=374606 RepID=UPI00210FFFC9|nr:SH3-like domain-containing protein [Aminobacter sp. MSH1]